VQALRRGFDLWNVALGDRDEETWRGALAEMVEAYDPAAEVDFSRTVPDFPATPAREAMTSWVQDARGTFTSIQVEPAEIFDAEDEVMVVIHIIGAGAASGIRLEADFFYVFRYRAERIISATTYKTREDALQVVGLA
jgi:ketosteroid isomerase-like protein